MSCAGISLRCSRGTGAAQELPTLRTPAGARPAARRPGRLAGRGTGGRGAGALRQCPRWVGGGGRPLSRASPCLSRSPLALAKAPLPNFEQLSRVASLMRFTCPLPDPFRLVSQFSPPGAPCVPAHSTERAGGRASRTPGRAARHTLQLGGWPPPFLSFSVHPHFLPRCLTLPRLTGGPWPSLEMAPWACGVPGGG